MSDRSPLLAALRERLQIIDRVRPAGRRAPLGFGLAGLDSALPWGGLARGGLHELVVDPGDGAPFGLLAGLLGRLRPGDGRVLWCRVPGETGAPYGPGLEQFGFPLDRLILIQPRRPAEALAMLEEALRCRRLAAVLGEGVVPTLTASRRLQLAAEAGDTLALLLMTARAQPPPSVALTRWRVSALPGRPEAGGLGRPRWSVALRRCRGGGQGEWSVEWDDEALRFALVAELADRPLAAAL